MSQSVNVPITKLINPYKNLNNDQEERRGGEGADKANTQDNSDNDFDMLWQVQEFDDDKMILNEPTNTNRDAFSAQFSSSPRKVKKL